MISIVLTFLLSENKVSAPPLESKYQDSIVESPNLSSLNTVHPLASFLYILHVSEMFWCCPFWLILLNMIPSSFIQIVTKKQDFILLLDNKMCVRVWFHNFILSSIIWHLIIFLWGVEGRVRGGVVTGVSLISEITPWAGTLSTNYCSSPWFVFWILLIVLQWTCACIFFKWMRCCVFSFVSFNQVVFEITSFPASAQLIFPYICGFSFLLGKIWLYVQGSFLQYCLMITILLGWVPTWTVGAICFLPLELFNVDDMLLPVILGYLASLWTCVVTSHHLNLTGLSDGHGSYIILLTWLFGQRGKA